MVSWYRESTVSGPAAYLDAIGLDGNEAVEASVRGRPKWRGKTGGKRRWRGNRGAARSRNGECLGKMARETHVRSEVDMVTGFWASVGGLKMGWSCGS
jgi:hypothetical protein